MLVTGALNVNVHTVLTLRNKLRPFMKRTEKVVMSKPGLLDQAEISSKQTGELTKWENLHRKCLNCNETGKPPLYLGNPLLKASL